MIRGQQHDSRRFSPRRARHCRYRSSPRLSPYVHDVGALSCKHLRLCPLPSFFIQLALSGKPPPFFQPGPLFVQPVQPQPCHSGMWSPPCQTPPSSLHCPQVISWTRLRPPPRPPLHQQQVKHSLSHESLAHFACFPPGTAEGILLQKSILPLPLLRSGCRQWNDPSPNRSCTLCSTFTSKPRTVTFYQLTPFSCARATLRISLHVHFPEKVVLHNAQPTLLILDLSIGRTE